MSIKLLQYMMKYENLKFCLPYPRIRCQVMEIIVVEIMAAVMAVVKVVVKVATVAVKAVMVVVMVVKETAKVVTSVTSVTVEIAAAETSADAVVETMEIVVVMAAVHNSEEIECLLNGTTKASRC